MKPTQKYAWDLIDSSLRFNEITAPTAAQIQANSLALYAKDKAGVSNLYFKDDAGVEHDIGLLGSGAAALTKVDDTNVTLTLGGSPTVALLAATSITVGWTGTLSAARGGTGVSSLGNVTAASTKITLAGTPTGAVINSFSIDVNQANLDHGSIGGLSDDDHTGYALLAGRSGGQTLIGGTGSGDDLTLQSTSHGTRGSVLITNDEFVIGGSRTMSTLEKGHMEITTTITNSASTIAGLWCRPTFSGNSSLPIGIIAQPTFTPGASINEAIGFWCDARVSPGNAITITQAEGGQSRLIYSDVAGAVTTGITHQISAPEVQGALLPTHQYGLNIANQGVAGMTYAFGLQVVAQAGATNNYDMSFTTVDTTAAGAYYGRVPVLYNGLKKYVHLFSA